MRLYLTIPAVKWSVTQLRLLPKNQTALLFFLIFGVSPEVGPSGSGSRADFEEEFYRYFGGPIRGGGIAVYDPFGGQWRAENYIHSTVYGRLLVGSHKWTEGSEAFFQRDPQAGGWPARFELTDNGFDNLRYRTESPCLKYEYRLPLAAVATYYFRFDDLSSYRPASQRDVVDIYRHRVVSKHPRLGELFVEGSSFMGALFSPEPASDSERTSCFPPSPFSMEPQQRALLYRGDIDYIRSRLENNETIADYVRRMIQGGRI